MLYAQSSSRMYNKKLMCVLERKAQQNLLHYKILLLFIQYLLNTRLINGVDGRSRTTVRNTQDIKNIL